MDRAPPIRCALRSHRVRRPRRFPGVVPALCFFVVYASRGVREGRGPPRGGTRRARARLWMETTAPASTRWPVARSTSERGSRRDRRRHRARPRARSRSAPPIGHPSRRSPREWDGGGARARARPGARRPVRSRASARDADGSVRVHPRRHRRIPPPPTGPRRPSRAAPHPTDDLSDAPELDTTDPHYSRTSNRFSAKKANAARPPPSLPHRTQWHPSHTRRRLTRPRRRPAHPPAPRGGARPRRTTRAATRLHPTIHPRLRLRRR